MKIEKCKICEKNEDSEYMHLLFWGTSKLYIKVCQECVDKLYKEKLDDQIHLPIM